MRLDGLLGEYKALRDEIISDQRRIQEITALTMTVVGLLIGYGISIIGEVSNFYFLSPLVIILPSSMIVGTLNTAILEKASYIRLKIEPKVAGMQWESLLYKNREKMRGVWKIQTICGSMLYASMGLLSIGLYLTVGGIGFVNLLISALLIGVVLAVCIGFSYYPITHEEKFNRVWGRMPL